MQYQSWCQAMIFKPKFKVRNRLYSFYTVEFDEDGLIDIFNCDVDLLYRLNLINSRKYKSFRLQYYFLDNLCFHIRVKNNNEN